MGSASTESDVAAGNTVVAANLGTLTFEPVTNFNGTASFTFKVTDSSDGESAAAATVTITVNAVNDLPTATDVSKSVNEDAPLTFAQSDFTGAFSDIDVGDTLKSVKIVTLPVATHGVLKAKVGSATTVTNVQVNDTVVAANLGTLTFEPVTNFNGTASFTFKVTDSSDGESAAAATVTITVSAANDVPTASDISKSVNEDAPLTFAQSDFTGAFSDIDVGDTLKSVKIVTLPVATHGVLKAKVGSATTVTNVQVNDTVVAANLGTLTFEPVTNFNGTASFTFKVTDSSDGESAAAATVTITVSAANDVPTASDISKSVNEDAPLTFAQSDFTDAFSDIDVGDTLKSVKIVTLPVAIHGVLKAKVGSATTVTDVQANDTIMAANLATLTFEPVLNFNGTVSFTFKVIDSMDGESAAAATVTITVNAVNDVPTASDISKSVNEDTTLTFARNDFTVAFSDIDVGDTLKSVKIVTLPVATHGVLKAKVGSATTVTDVQANDTIMAVNLGTLTFEPVLNFNGTVSFTFKVIDSMDGESAAAATVTITVNAVNDVPTASDISKSVNEDTTLTFAQGDFTGVFSDIDSGDTLKSVKIVTLPAATHGKLIVGTADPPTTVQVNDEIVSTNLGTLKFEPVANWNGTASFTFKVIDSMDGVSVAAATVTITVNAVNDVPVANAGDDRGVNPGDQVTLAGSATDIEGDPLTFSWVQTDGISVTLSGANTATPSFTAPQPAGGLTFKLTVSDGPNSNSDSVTITVGDTAPSFGSASVSDLKLTSNEEMEPIVLPEATGGNGTLTYSLSSEPSGLAGLSFDSTTRTLSGEPNSLGRHVFTWRAEDADDNRTNDAAVLTFNVSVDEPLVARKTTIEQTLAGVTTRVMSGAVANIGTRFTAAPVAAPRVSIAGRDLPFAGTQQIPDTFAAAETCATSTPGYHEWRRQQRGLDEGCQNSLESVSWKEMLRDSSFEISLLSPSGFGLSSAGFGPGGGNSLVETDTPQVTLWGRGDLLTFEGRPEPETRYDGEALTGYLGIDTNYGDWLAGVAVSHGKSKTNYYFDGGEQAYEQGILETELTMVHPYGRWDWNEDREVWTVLGAGWGTVTHVTGHQEDEQPPESSKLEVWMASAGLRQELKSVGDFKLAFRTDLSFAHVETAESESGIEQSINGITADVARLRFGFEASRTWTLENGQTLTPFAEAMIRYDDGDGETGTGVEVSGGLRYNSERVEVEMLARTLVVHSADDYRESGASITARVKPKSNKIGLSMSISPQWGAAPKKTDALWGDELSDANTVSASDYSWALDGMIGYGIGIPRTDGVLTPFSEIRLSEKDGRRVRVGTKFGFASQNADRNYELEFAGERHDRKNGEVDRLISFNYRRQIGKNYGDSFDIKLTGERKANDSDYSYGVQLNLRFSF